MLITCDDDWPVADVIAGYRSQSDAEASFLQMKDPHVASFSRCFTRPNTIRIHTVTRVLALQIANLIRLQADRAGRTCPYANCCTNSAASAKPTNTA